MAEYFGIWSAVIAVFLSLLIAQIKDRLLLGRWLHEA